MSPWRLRQIALQLNHGKVIAYPTDTIWGLGCHPMQLAAVRRIQLIKQRPLRKALILLSSSLDFFQAYADEKLLRQQADSIRKQRSRPVTWVVKAGPHCPSWLTGGSQTIAIRVSNKEPIRQLCEAIRAPLVSTSANISGHPSARNGLIVHKIFHRQVDFIIEGFTCDAGKASQIRDLESGKILRP